MHTLEKKKKKVKEIKEKFINSNAVVFYNFHNIENRDLFLIKKELKAVGSDWKVYKNKLVKKAISDYNLNFDIKNANAFLFFNDDKYEPLSILGKFNRKKSLTGKFNGGIYDNSFIDPLTLEKWSKLPSKEFMISNLCYFLNFNLNRLTGVLENLKKD